MPVLHVVPQEYCKTIVGGGGVMGYLIISFLLNMFRFHHKRGASCKCCSWFSFSLKHRKAVGVHDHVI